MNQKFKKILIFNKLKVIVAVWSIYLKLVGLKVQINLEWMI